jgi:ferredoxin
VLQKKIFSGGCPVALTPRTMDRSECQLCLECVRNCSKGNLGVFYGAKTSSAPFSTPAGVLFIFLTGLVTLALSRTWPAVRDALTPGIHPSSLVVALWLGALVPAAILFAGPLISHLGFKSAGKDSKEPSGATAPESVEEAEKGLTLWERFRITATPFAGIIFGGHSALALVKLNAKGLYAPYLVYDPTGAATYMAINVSKTLPLPQMFMPLPVLRWVAMGLLLLGVAAGLAETRKAWEESLGKVGKGINYLAFLSLAVLYGALIQHWLFGGG